MRTLRPALFTGLAAVLAASFGLASSAHAGPTHPGINVNTITFNALSINALTLNALNFNSLSFNALTVNGQSRAGTIDDVTLSPVHGLTLPSGVSFVLPE